MGKGQYHQMSHVGGCGSKISQKSVTYYMNGFLTKMLDEIDFRKQINLKR